MQSSNFKYDIVLLSGGQASRLNRFTASYIDKTEFFELDNILIFKDIAIRLIVLGKKDIQYNVSGDDELKDKIIYKDYNLKNSYKELVQLYQEFKLSNPFIVQYGDIYLSLTRNEILDLLNKSKLLYKSGYEIIILLYFNLFDHELGNVMISNLKPQCLKYLNSGESSWLDCGFYIFYKFNTSNNYNSLKEYIEAKMHELKVGFLVINKRPKTINTIYDLWEESYSNE